MNEKTLQTLQDILAEELLARIKSGEATPSDLNVARQLLKDNAIVVDIRREDSPTANLADKLPFRRVD